MTAITGNFSQVEAALARVAVRTEAASHVWEGEAANTIAARAAQLAPRFTGHLAASTDESGGQVVVNTDYGVYVEYGTRRSKAQPFLRPAADQVSPAIYAEAERTFTVATQG